MKRLTWLFILFLFVPSVTTANSLEIISGKLAIHAGEKQFRIRATTKLIQLANIEGIVVDQFTFGDELFAVVERNGQKFVLRTDDGLGYQTVPGLADEPVVTYRNDEQLLIHTGAKVLRYVQGKFVVVAEPVVGSILDRYYYGTSSFLYLDLQLSILTVFGYEGAEWTQLDEMNCATATVIKADVPTVLCDDKLFQFSVTNNFIQLNSENLTWLASTPEFSVFAGQTNTNLIFILTPSQLIELTLPILEPVTAAKIISNRIFIFIGNQYYELAYQLPVPELFVAPANSGDFVEVSGTNWVYFQNGAQSWLTTGLNSWQPAVTVAVFDRAAKYSSGIILWKFDGADIQFSTDGLNFSLRNGSWARSAKIKAISEYNEQMYLLLLNSSLAPNIYRSLSMTTWTRLTLPTKPTYQLSIREARLATAGTLFELSGTVSAGQGVVSDETFYLQDQSGGVQIFLSKTKGQLSNIQGKLAVVTGELSTSQTKRIIIDAPDDATIGAPSTVISLPIPITTTGQHLGELVSLRGRAVDIDEDTFTLNDQFTSVKSHFPSSKEKIKSNDDVTVSAITDWNSASSAIETWVLPGSLAINSSLPKTSNEPKAVQATSSSKKASSSSSKAVSPTVTVAAATNKIIPIDTRTASQESQSSELPTPLPTYVILIFSSVGLLVAARGKRFREVLADSS